MNGCVNESIPSHRLFPSLSAAWWLTSTPMNGDILTWCCVSVSSEMSYMSHLISVKVVSVWIICLQDGHSEQSTATPAPARAMWCCLADARGEGGEHRNVPWHVPQRSLAPTALRNMAESSCVTQSCVVPVSTFSYRSTLRMLGPAAFPPCHQRPRLWTPAAHSMPCGEVPFSPGLGNPCWFNVQMEDQLRTSEGTLGSSKGLSLSLALPLNSPAPGPTFWHLNFLIWQD